MEIINLFICWEKIKIIVQKSDQKDAQGSACLCFMQEGPHSMRQHEALWQVCRPGQGRWVHGSCSQEEGQAPASQQWACWLWRFPLWSVHHHKGHDSARKQEQTSQDE